MNYRVVDTDNFDGDYPNEQWVGPPCEKQTAENVANAFNAECSDYGPRYYKVVKLPYELRPGFEP